MAGETQPLLANDNNRQSDADSQAEAQAEDDALHGLSAPTHGKYDFWQKICLFMWAVIATAIVIILAVVSQHPRDGGHPPHGPGHTPHGKRNLIFMVSDGMGPASLSLTRSFRQTVDALPFGDVLTLDQHLIGSSRTRSDSSLVTDSAAGATAFSCGMKSYNGAISMLPDHTPCGTVLEAAKRAGYMTGLVVTTDITDATPACFAAHVNIRQEEDRIAEQEIGEHPLGRVVDLMLGGGRCHFLPNGTKGGCRADDRDLTKIAQEEHGWTYVNDRDGFDGLNGGNSVKLPLLGLFAPTDIPFEIDRRNEADTYPSLSEMAQTAITALEAATQDSDKGFFLMIEGSRIDHAGHGNDPAAQVHEVLAYDKTFAAVLDFLERSDVEGVVVSTSDHETGGLSVARQLHSTYPEYLWHPEILANASHSSSHLGHELHEYMRAPEYTSLDAETQTDKLSAKILDLIETGLGVPANSVDDTEVQNIVENPVLASWLFADIISKRAQIGWSTHGHSAVDVNIYGSRGSHNLTGNHENTDVGKFLRSWLGVDAGVEEVTEELRKAWKKDEVRSMAGRVPTVEEVMRVGEEWLVHDEELRGLLG